MTTDAHPTKEDIIALETSYWDAMKAKNRGGSVCLHSPARLLSGAAAGFMPLREAVG